jgi:hypothetical protein
VVGSDWFSAKSWLGGAPKLGSTPWPRDNKGKPLHFLAQLDLSEIAAASGGQTALPTKGAFAFFVGGTLTGGVVYVNDTGTQSTPVPVDLGSVEDIGCDPFVTRANRYGPTGFPYWPVEYRKLPFRAQAYDPNEGSLEILRDQQREAIRQLYPTRSSDFSATYVAKTAGLGEVPLFWLAALMFAERVPKLRDRVADAKVRGQGYIDNSIARLKALEAGLPPPAGQGRFGDPAKEKANSESWLAAGRKIVANADAQQAAVEDYVARVKAAAMAADPWTEVSREDAGRLDQLFGEAHGKAMKEFSRSTLPHSWREYAKDAIKLAAAGPNEAFARLPTAWRDIINTQFRMPGGGAHLMFGVGDDIQGNQMFEDRQMRMLLQLTHDDMLYWPFGDDGVYQYWMPVDALRAGDVSRAVTTFEVH